MNALTPFQFEGRNVRIVEIDGETWFIATDVARELGYGLASDLLKNLDPDEKGMCPAHTLGGEQTLTIISEAGVYRSIVQRKLNKKQHDHSLFEKVSRFQRFVFHDVLPQIRQTGSYIPPAPVFVVPQTKAEMLQLAADQAKQIEQQEAQIATLVPKAAFVDRFVEAGGRYGLQNAGRALGCRPNKFIDWLKAEGFIFYADGSLVPRQQYLQSGLFEVKNTVGGDDKVHTQSFMTPKGVSYFASRIPPAIKSREPTTALAAPDHATAH
jgi:prophage antirepressor-like protein